MKKIRNWKNRNWKKWKKSGKKQQKKKTVKGCNEGELSWGKRICVNNIVAQEDIVEKQRKQAEKKEEKSAEELFCSFLAAELKELPEHERYMTKNELQNVIFKYQMMVLNRQRQIPNYRERQDSCQYFMSGIPSQYSHTQISSPPATPIWTPQYRKKT